MEYVDTSVIVAALVQESHTPRAERWLAGRSDELAISDWTLAEFSSALSIKVRSGSLDPEGQSVALETFATLTEQSLLLLPVKRAHFRLAAQFADRHALGLRAADALHLAIAADHGASLCTLDKKLAAAGKTLGIATKLL
jgi:predicted nucleic acid-binding protein